MSLIPTPAPWLKVFDFLPGYVYAAALAIVVIGGGVALGVEEMRMALKDTQIATGEKRIAQLKLDAEHDRTERAQLVADHNMQVAEMQAAHAKKQQEIADEYQEQKRQVALEHVRGLDRADRVRDAADREAAASRRAGEGESPAFQRLADQNATLFGLLADGYRLVVESRKVVGDRDNEVAALMQIINNDRAAICGAHN